MQAPSIPAAQMQFVDEYAAQLVKFGLVKKNNLSKWASHAVPVRKSDAKTDFRATNNYIEVNKRTVPIAGTMPHFSVILSFLHWSVVEKEAYPVVRACVSLDYILEREGGFKAFCYHSNLIQIFSPSESVKKHTRGKLLRWALRISCLRYPIEHIDGKRNLWADIVSRWKPGNAEIGPARMLVKVARIAALSRIRPMQDDKFTWPTIESVRAAQDAAGSPGAEFKQNEQGIWVADGKIWLPPNDNALIVRVMIVAHCGVRAHRGAEAMLLLLRDELYSRI
ncbi:unnamed protein product [Phytophthora fragariaefolia]|uniref:Unnamed protein product n=1 Tax=Phytophthora fragariaefolia TaxID=1490495 RepID=A0A9W6XDT3_9STRA|nr:unnamed protein product [Phytophthora fragariaefolia]